MFTRQLAEQRTAAGAIRPFRVEIPEEAIADLRRRIAATRWPGEETVADQSQGVQLATIFQVPRSWAEKIYPNLIYFHEADGGGHFAAWEQPQIFSAEVRAAFGPLR